MSHLRGLYIFCFKLFHQILLVLFLHLQCSTEYFLSLKTSNFKFLSELATTRHAELYVTWCVRLLSLISKKPQLKRKAKAAARLAARAVRTHRGDFICK